MVFAHIDFCKDLRNRIAHPGSVWKVGPLMIEARPRSGITIVMEQAASTTPPEARSRMARQSRLDLAVGRVLNLLRWLWPGLSDVYLAGRHITASPRRWGDDLAIRLPNDLADGWREGDPVEVGNRTEVAAETQGNLGDSDSTATGSETARPGDVQPRSTASCERAT